MTEKPSKNLEYSKYDEDMVRADRIAADIKAQIPQMEREIEECRTKIEEIKTDPTYDEEERAKAIADYGRMIETVQATIKDARETIGLSHLLGGVDQILKDQADELLKKGESLDPLTADIENEGKPPRRVN